MLPQALLGLMGSEFTGMVPCFSKWAGVLQIDGLGSQVMELSLEAEGSWGMLFLGLPWIRPSDLEALRGSDRSCLFFFPPNAHISLGYGVQGVVGPVITGRRPGRQSLLPASS